MMVKEETGELCLLQGFLLGDFEEGTQRGHAVSFTAQELRAGIDPFTDGRQKK